MKEAGFRKQSPGQGCRETRGPEAGSREAAGPQDADGARGGTGWVTAMFRVMGEGRAFRM